MAITIKEIYNPDFSAGMVTRLPGHQIPDGASTDTENWDLSETVGALVKRKGSAVAFTQLAAGEKVVGLYEFIDSAAAVHIVAARNDDVYEVTAPGTWTSIFNSASMNGAETNMAQLKNLCVIVNQNITTQKWSGSGATSNLLGTPPANAKYIVRHANRLFIANSSAGKSRVHYSSLNDPEDWTTTGDSGAGFIDVTIDDGDQITGIASLGAALIVFKRHTTHVVYGHKPSNFVTRLLSPTVGCISNRSIVVTDSQCLFAGIDGVWAFGPTGPPTLVSSNIQPTYDALSTTVKEGIAAGRLGTQYWMAYDSDADNNNDKAYVFDYVDGIWFRYSPVKANVFANTRAGLFYSGGSDHVVIRQHDTGSQDESTAITASWDSKVYDDGSFVDDKQLMDFHLNAEASSGNTISWRVLLNGVLQSETLSFSLTPDDPTSAATAVMAKSNALDAMAAKFFQFRISNATASFLPKIYGYSCAFERRERQN